MCSHLHVAQAGRLTLPDPATVAVVGGGPAGSFFAIRLLRRMREQGHGVRLVVFEKKTEVCFYRPVPFCAWEGCNYCAGGISPRLSDILAADAIAIPREVVESEAEEVVVHGDWKSIQLPVPEHRRMLTVFRGSRPRSRTDRYENFDTFLLRSAEEEGAEVITAEVEGLSYSTNGRPVIAYRTQVDTDASVPPRTFEADFLTLTAGVNRSPGTAPASDPLFRLLRELAPRLRPPKVRRTVIAEMYAEDELLRPLNGEVHFVQYGSRQLHIEMGSLLPKDTWMTVVLLGKSVDEAGTADSLAIVRDFMDLPHIQRLLPPGARLQPGCTCHPSMTVGAARHPYAARLALAGDMAVSRLYKDGLYSAYVTASALADCILDEGVDEASLARGYEPVVKGLHADNRYGRVIFLLSRWVFGHPGLSRILYQAVLSERKNRPPSKRRLAGVLWRTASGDDTYRRILTAMLHPASIWLIFAGGLLITARNRATEYVFGLDWSGIGRYPTGVPREEVEQKRRELFALQGLQPPARAPEIEKMYSIRIRAGRDAILRRLGAFGDPDRQYFTPRFIEVRRTRGEPNQVGTIIHYQVPFGLSFNLALERAAEGRYLLYRILDGFGRGGIFAFDIDRLRPRVNLLTIYVGFDFPRGRNLAGRIGWALGRRLFPRFAHDVVWNHSLCRIKQLAEAD